jgi:hypothetical protein
MYLKNLKLQFMSARPVPLEAAFWQQELLRLPA